MMDLAKLNSLTKYPSIPTWHVLDGKGVLTDSATTVDAGTAFYLTEKVDGTNGRIVRLGRSWWIGSRDNLIASNDGSVNAVKNPLEQAIVDTLKPIADRLRTTDFVVVWFFEVFGANIGDASREYAPRNGEVSCRLFDRAVIADSASILNTMNPEQISSWRKRGGQTFDSLVSLRWSYTEIEDLVLAVPFLGIAYASEMPVTLEDGRPFIEKWIGKKTRCALDPAALGRPEGIVARTADRRVIVKLRLSDYDKAIRKRTAVALEAKKKSSGRKP